MCSIEIDKQVISTFLEQDRKNIENDLASFKNVYSAARAENYLGKKHSHQYLIKPIILEGFAQRIVEKEAELRNAKSFEEIYSIVQSCRIKGIGNLALYDTAVRIGHQLNKPPLNVYLHQGTRIGASKLGIHGNIIPKFEFDKFGLNELTAHEIECFLCIYRSFIGNSNPTNPIKSKCIHFALPKSRCLKD